LQPGPTISIAYDKDYRLQCLNLETASAHVHSQNKEIEVGRSGQLLRDVLGQEGQQCVLRGADEIGDVALFEVAIGLVCPHEPLPHIQSKQDTYMQSSIEIRHHKQGIHVVAN